MQMCIDYAFSQAEVSRAIRRVLLSHFWDLTLSHRNELLVKSVKGRCLLCSFLLFTSGLGAKGIPGRRVGIPAGLGVVVVVVGHDVVEAPWVQVWLVGWDVAVQLMCGRSSVFCPHMMLWSPGFFLSPDSSIPILCRSRVAWTRTVVWAHILVVCARIHCSSGVKRAEVRMAPASVIWIASPEFSVKMWSSSLLMKSIFLV